MAPSPACRGSEVVADAGEPFGLLPQALGQAQIACSLAGLEHDGISGELAPSAWSDVRSPGYVRIDSGPDPATRRLHRRGG
jgi:hypothetical protein